MRRVCCLCVPLRVCCRALAILYAVLNAVGLLCWLVFCVCVVATASPAEHHANYPAHRHRLLVFFVYVLLPLAAICGGGMAVCVLMAKGVQRSERRMMLPWLVWHGCLQTLGSVLWLVFAVWLFRSVAQYSAHEEFGAVVAATTGVVASGCLLLALVWYWYWEVFQYYQQLETGQLYHLQTWKTEHDYKSVDDPLMCKKPDVEA